MYTGNKTNVYEREIRKSELLFRASINKICNECERETKETAVLSAACVSHRVVYVTTERQREI